MPLDFEFQNGSNKAIVLFHGLTGSPFELKKFGYFLFQNGFDVFCKSLPGHGQDCKNIYTITYNDWLQFSYNEFDKLYEKYDEVYVSGLCLGAVLALNLAIKYPKKVKGIVSLSTTLFLDGWRLPFYRFLIPIGLSTILRFYYSYPECEPHGIKNQKVRSIVKKLLEKGDVGLNDFPMTGIYELLKLSKVVRKNLDKIETPILLIHSKDDDLTSPKSAYCVYNRIKSPKKELIILKDSYHMVLYDNEKEFVFNKVLEFLNSLNEIKSQKEMELCC